MGGGEEGERYTYPKMGGSEGPNSDVNLRFGCRSVSLPQKRFM